ncbi:MAG: hypothetical protein BV459_00265 [Thermoplasmata archaeon M11B2D]|nr:MAG: hypothetical protein BV459_00265 [Thermoplasmata archaeon M11B2D]
MLNIERNPERFAPVEGEPDLVRDVKTGAILNANNTALARAREAKSRTMKDKKRIAALEETVSKINNDMGEMKDLLKTIANSIGNK